MLLYFIVFFYLPQTILTFSCQPTDCILLCCSDQDQCSTFSSTCIRSACSNSLCSTKCCVEGRCGTETECLGITSTAHILVWTILAVICSIICMIMCMYFVYEKMLKKRTRVEIGNEEEAIEMSPEVIQSSEFERLASVNGSKQNQIPLSSVGIDYAKHRLVKIVKAEKNKQINQELNDEQKDTDSAQEQVASGEPLNQLEFYQHQVNLDKESQYCVQLGQQ